MACANRRGIVALNGSFLSDVSDARARSRLPKALKYAIKHDRTALCKRIVERTPDLNTAVDDCGACGPLLYALRLQREEIALNLVTSGASLEFAACASHNLADFDSAHYAVKMGASKLLEVLFKKGYRCSGPVHPIHAAIALGGWRQLKCAEVILEYTSREIHRHDSDAEATLTADPFDFRVGVQGHKWPWHLLESIPDNKAWVPTKTALQHSVFCGFETLVCRLLDCGASIDAVDSHGRTALHVAAAEGSKVMVKILREKGADHTIRTTQRRETPLFAAIRSRNIAVVELLLDSASIDLRDSKGWSALHVCIENIPNEELLGKCLSLSPDVNATNDEGVSLLHSACSDIDRLDIVRFLLKSGADVNHRNIDGTTPLMWAASIEICKALMQNGARLDDVDIYGKNVLHHAMQLSDGADLVDWLYETDINILLVKNIDGCPPTHYGFESSEPAIHQRILDPGLEPNYDCEFNCGSILHEACRQGQTAIFEKAMLCMNTAKFQEISQKTNTFVAPLLTLTAQCGMTDMMSLVLDAGADVNITGEKWGSPVYVACDFGRLEIVKLLLAKDPEARCIDRQGKAVTMLEASRNDQKLLEWLRTRKACTAAREDEETTAVVQGGTSIADSL